MSHEEDFEPSLASLLDEERKRDDLAPEHAVRLAARFADAIADHPGSDLHDDALSPQTNGGVPGAAAPLVASLPAWVKAGLLLSTGALLGAAGHAFFRRDVAHDGAAATVAPQPDVPQPDASPAEAPPAEAPPAPPRNAASETPVTTSAPESDRTTREDLPAPNGRSRAAPSPEPGRDQARRGKPSEGETPSSPAENTAESTTAPTPAAAPSTQSERLLVDRARAAVARGDGLSALEAVDEHRRRYADGQFAEERDALAIDALLLQRRTADAQRKAREFLERYPKSVFTHRVERVLQR